jgi:Flp pilus assembly pilin Flp
MDFVLFVTYGCLAEIIDRPCRAARSPFPAQRLSRTRKATMHCLRRFLCSSEAATAVEYCVMLALIFLTLLAAVIVFGLESNQLWLTIGGELEQANS